MTEFYREFIMSRLKFEPSQFGVDLPRGEFDDRICEFFNETYKGHWTVDEMLLHPSEALRFCADLRARYRWFEVPEDIILRVVMNRRKG